MRPNKRRISSDEVIIEIKDSESRGKNYWNFREDGREYSYSQRNNSKEDLHDEISVEFNLNENRNLTEEQKQTILNTLTWDSREYPEQTRIDNLQKWNFLLLLLILAGVILLLITAKGW